MVGIISCSKIHRGKIEVTLSVKKLKPVIYTGWAKKNAYKTETFLLFGKIGKKLIIAGISIINSIITQRETILL